MYKGEVITNTSCGRYSFFRSYSTFLYSTLLPHICQNTVFRGRFKKIVYGQTFFFYFYFVKTTGIELQENKVKEKIHPNGRNKKVLV